MWEWWSLTFCFNWNLYEMKTEKLNGMRMRWAELMNKRMEWSWFRVLTKVEQIRGVVRLRHLKHVPPPPDQLATAQKKTFAKYWEKQIFRQNILKKIVIVTLLCIQINGVTILVIRCEIFARDLSIMDLIEGNWAIIYHDDNAWNKTSRAYFHKGGKIMRLHVQCYFQKFSARAP